MKQSIALLLAPLAMLGCQSGHVGNSDGPYGEATQAAVVALGSATVTSISAGSDHTCAVSSTGSVLCWGKNDHGQLGDGSTTRRLQPVTASGLAQATKISAGASHSCAIASGQVFCWGSGSSGRLGTGSTQDRRSPTAVVDLAANAVAVSAGASHTCAVVSPGGVWCWGSNLEGQLGNGGILGSNRPVQASGITNAIAVGAGGDFSCALLSSGHVWCWGEGADGRLGNDSIFDSRVPVHVLGGLIDAIALSVGQSHACALRRSGDVVCWGEGSHGELGNGSNDDRRVPVAVSNTLARGRSKSVTAGDGHTCAMLDGGIAYCWGAGTSGQLGNCASASTRDPVPAFGLRQALGVSAGSGHTCAVTVDKKALCWGANAQGELGDGTQQGSNVPTGTCPSPPATSCYLARLSSHEYWVCSTSKQWSQAQSSCRAKGFELARIDTAAENGFVQRNVLTDTWVGGSDQASEGTWVWSNDGGRFWTSGAPADGRYSNFRAGRPRNDSLHDCLQVFSDGTWVDDGCNELEQFICERDTGVDPFGGSLPPMVHSQPACSSPDSCAELVHRQAAARGVAALVVQCQSGSQVACAAAGQAYAEGSVVSRDPARAIALMAASGPYRGAVAEIERRQNPYVTHAPTLWRR